jgi:hypothetical protein
MNKWTYVLVFDDAAGTRREVLDFLDNRPEILDWYTCMSNAVFLISRKTASELGEIFKDISQGKSRFMILDANTDRNGWLPRQAWDFIRKSERSEDDKRTNK